MSQTNAVTFHPPAAAISLPDAATWPLSDVLALFDLPFNDLMFRAQTVHRANFPAGDVELATLLSIKTGGCEEDCSYCPQAARYDTGVEAKKILGIETVLDAARLDGAEQFAALGDRQREIVDRPHHLGRPAEQAARDREVLDEATGEQQGLRRTATIGWRDRVHVRPSRPWRRAVHRSSD